MGLYRKRAHRIVGPGVKDDDGWLLTNDMPGINASAADVLAGNATVAAASSSSAAPATESFSSSASFKKLVSNTLAKPLSL